VILLAAALVLGLGTWGLVSYTRNSYFVAADRGYVAVYNGLPGSVLGVELSSMVGRTDIPVANLPRFYQRAVENAISVSNREAAAATTGELRAMAERCMQVRKERQEAADNPPPIRTATPTPTYTGPGLPLAPGVTLSPSETPKTGAAGTRAPLAPATTLETAPPSAAEEADPEAC
jgi:protein phosphatase